VGPRAGLDTEAGNLISSQSYCPTSNINVLKNLDFLLYVLSASSLYYFVCLFLLILLLFTILCLYLVVFLLVFLNRIPIVTQTSQFMWLC
jgi:hypothetical protein